MSSPRLRVQFETLFEKFSGNDTEVQLEDITEALFCTRRNARIVLNKLEEEDWIEWHPAASRRTGRSFALLSSTCDVEPTKADAPFRAAYCAPSV